MGMRGILAGMLEMWVMGWESGESGWECADQGGNTGNRGGYALN